MRYFSSATLALTTARLRSERRLLTRLGNVLTSARGAVTSGALAMLRGIGVVAGLAVAASRARTRTQAKPNSLSSAVATAPREGTWRRARTVASSLWRRATGRLEHAVVASSEPHGFRWLVLAVVLATLPALALLFTLHAGTLLTQRAASGTVTDPMPPSGAGIIVIATGLGGLVALYSFALAALWFRSVQRNARLERDRDRLDARVQSLDDELRETRDETNLLSAIREVSRALARETDVEGALSDVVGVLVGYLNPQRLALYLPANAPATRAAGAWTAVQPIGENLIAYASLERGGDVRIAGARPSGARDDADVDAATRTGGMAMPPLGLASLTDDDRDAIARCQATRAIDQRLGTDAREVTLALPVEAGDVVPGVLHVTLDLDGPTREAREGVAASTARRLAQFMRHVTVTVKHLTLYDRAVMDGLTRLYNRRAGEERVQAAYALCKRVASPIAVVLCDIDHFKKVNDTYGHAAGDRVLAGVAAILRETVREADIVFRYGGEEMVICCPNASAEEASQVAERVREAIEAATFNDDHGKSLNVTSSFGIAATGLNTPSSELATPAPDTPRSSRVAAEIAARSAIATRIRNISERRPAATDYATLEALCASADAALYASKHAGRNRVTIAA